MVSGVQRVIMELFAAGNCSFSLRLAQLNKHHYVCLVITLLKSLKSGDVYGGEFAKSSW